MQYTKICHFLLSHVGLGRAENPCIRSEWTILDPWDALAVGSIDQGMTETRRKVSEAKPRRHWGPAAELDVIL